MKVKTNKDQGTMRYSPGHQEVNVDGADLPFDQQIETKVRNEFKVLEGKVNLLAGHAKGSALAPIVSVAKQQRKTTLAKINGFWDQLVLPIKGYISENKTLLKQSEGVRFEDAKDLLQPDTDKKLAKVDKEEQDIIPLQKESDSLGERARGVELKATEFEDSQDDQPTANFLHKDWLYLIAQSIVGVGEAVANYKLLQGLGGMANGAIPALVLVISCAMAFTGHAIPEAIHFKRKKSLKFLIACGALAVAIPVVLRLFFAEGGGTVLVLFPPLLFLLGLSLGFARKWVKYFKWDNESKTLYAQRDTKDAEITIIKDDAEKKRETIKKDQENKAKNAAKESTIQMNICLAENDLKKYEARKEDTQQQVENVVDLAIEEAMRNAARPGKSRQNGQYKPGAGATLSLVFVLALFFLSGCSGTVFNEPEPIHFYEIGLLDVTDSHFEQVESSTIRDKLTLPSDKKVSVHKYNVKLSVINDKHMQVYQDETLDYALEYLARDEKARIDKQIAFLQKALDSFSTFPTSQKKGLSGSFVFQAIKFNANTLARSGADRKRLHIWSDLFENSPPFRIYDHVKNPREIFENGNEEKIISALDAYFNEEEYEDWQGIEVIVYYEADKAADELYTAARRLFRTWLESYNAQVSFEVMI